MYFGKTSRQVHDFSFRVSTLKRPSPYSILAVLSLFFQYLSQENLNLRQHLLTSQALFYRKSPIRHNLKRKIIIKCGIFFLPAFYLQLSTFKVTHRICKPRQEGPGAIVFASSDQLAVVSWIIFF